MRCKTFIYGWLILLAMAVHTLAGDIYWTPTAPAVPQKTTLTFSAVADDWISNPDVTVTCNNKDVIVTLGDGASESDAASQVAAAINSTDTSNTTFDLIAGETKNIGGQLFEEFTKFKAAAVGAVITLTSTTDGEPFIVTVTETATGSVAVLSDGTGTSQLATSENHYNDANNWDTGAVPVNADDVFIIEGSTDILYWGSADPANPQSILIGPGYNGNIGLELNNPAGYRNYLPRYLPIEFDFAGDVFRIEGGRRIQIDTKAVEGVVHVTRGNVSLVSTATITLNVLSGSVETGNNGATTCKLGTIVVGDEEGSRGSLVMSSSTTFAISLPITIYEGTVTLDAAHADEKIVYKGNLTVGSGAQATITLRGGNLVYNSTGTITTLTQWAGGSDFSQDIRTKTVTNLVMYNDTYFWDPLGNVTLTNGIDLIEGGLHQVDIKSLKSRTWTSSGL